MHKWRLASYGEKKWNRKQRDILFALRPVLRYTNRDGSYRADNFNKVPTHENVRQNWGTQQEDRATDSTREVCSRYTLPFNKSVCPLLKHLRHYKYQIYTAQNISSGCCFAFFVSCDLRELTSLKNLVKLLQRSNLHTKFRNNTEKY